VPDRGGRRIPRHRPRSPQEGYTETSSCVWARLVSNQRPLGRAGSSLEAVGRALRTMRSLGWIETRRREIRVLDLDALRGLVD
jgi:hypothetical protein